MSAIGPREISLVFILFNILIIFCMLFESKYPPKKTWTITFILMGALILLNMAGFAVFGLAFMAKWFLITCTVPSCIFFLIITKYRNGQFFFTFCLADIFALWIMSITFFIAAPFDDNEYVLLFSRIILFTVSNLLIYRYVRKPYHAMLKILTNGWWMWAVMSILIYAILGLMIGWPTPLNERMEQIPVFIMMIILVPLIFGSVFRTLVVQMRWLQAKNDEMIFKLQAESLKKQQQDMEAAEQKRRIERHDFRHVLQNVYALLASGDSREASSMIEEYISNTEEDIKQHIYCRNAVINAILNYNIETAARMNIVTVVKCDLPGELYIDEVGFSTVMANAFENACNACSLLPEEERIIHVTMSVNENGTFFFEMENPYKEEVEFDQEGLPVSREKGHGVGTRSMVAFANKSHAHIDYEAEDHVFTFRIIIEQKKCFK